MAIYEVVVVDFSNKACKRYLICDKEGIEDMLTEMIKDGILVDLDDDPSDWPIMIEDKLCEINTSVADEILLHNKSIVTVKPDALKKLFTDEMEKGIPRFLTSMSDPSDIEDMLLNIEACSRSGVWTLIKNKIVCSVDDDDDDEEGSDTQLTKRAIELLGAGDDDDDDDGDDDDDEAGSGTKRAKRAIELLGAGDDDDEDDPIPISEQIAKRIKLMVEEAVNKAMEH